MSNIPSDEWTNHIRAAFPYEDLTNRIKDAAAAEPTQLPQLFYDLSTQVLSLRAQLSTQDGHSNAKKRKLENDTEPNHLIVPKSAPWKLLPTLFECKDVSVQVPARKKMKLELANDPGDSKLGHVGLVNPSTSEMEYALPPGEVDAAFCLPVPEKQARQSNFVLFPKLGAMDAFDRPAEQLLFVMNEIVPPNDTLQGNTLTDNDTFVTVTESALNMWLKPHGKRVIKPKEAEFASSIPQSHRKGEKAYHVKAHRGSKEGYLFFLENGIVFGFKKPLAFFPFSSIESISYTSVLQRTFNLVIAAMETGDPSQVKEIEFSMLDQEDFAGIDAYVKRHGLNDASMAAQRRAKAYNVNKEKKSEVDDDVNGDVKEDGQTELQKAEQQLQDEEDELEEDYEVSGGESEGEDEDSEEEEAYDDNDEVEEVEGDYEDEEE